MSRKGSGVPEPVMGDHCVVELDAMDSQVDKEVPPSPDVTDDPGIKRLPRIGHISLISFFSFLTVVGWFTAFTDVILIIVSVRAEEHGAGFSTLVVTLNYLWILVHIFLLFDWWSVFLQHFTKVNILCCCPSRKNIVIDTDSKFPQPLSWIWLRKSVGCCRRSCPDPGTPDYKLETINPHTYLLLVSLLVPVNTILFYDGLASPVYSEQQLQNKNVPALLAGWPTGGNLTIDIIRGKITDSADTNFSVLVNATNCYAMDSYEFEILQKLTDQSYPKQPYCETLLGTMMVNSAQSYDHSEDSWTMSDDRWDEAFEFSTRLFSALAGIVADTIQEDISSPVTFFGGMGFWFMKDMSDVYDMFMLTYADTSQLNEGRPVLSAFVNEMTGYHTSFHTHVYTWIWLGFFVVVLRALNLVGVHPVATLVRCCLPCCKKSNGDRLRVQIDSVLSLCFIEIPYFCLRWLAWRYYGLPVSVMAVKNVLGIFDDLRYLGIVRGLQWQHEDEEIGTIEKCLCGCLVKFSPKNIRLSRPPSKHESS